MAAKTKLTPKQEAFCLAYLKMHNASDAYRQAYETGGMKPESINREAHAVLNNPKVAARIEVLQRRIEVRAAQLVDKLAVSKERIITELAKIGFANMLDYIQPTENGSAYVDLSKLDRDQAAAIGEVVVEEYTEGRGDDARDVKRTKFKLLDKRSALVDLGKHLGMFIERREVGAPGDFAEKSDEELAAEIASEAEEFGLISPGSQTVN